MKPATLSRDTLHILIAVADRERHGYAILQDVRERTDGHVLLSPSTLYSAIKRLLDETQGRPRSLRGAAAVSAAIRVSEEAQEGIRAFLEKRLPSWVETQS